MNKLKLFLLGSIITLLSIGSFSNASGVSGVVTCSTNNGYCTPMNIPFNDTMDIQVKFNSSCQISIEGNRSTFGLVSNGQVKTLVPGASNKFSFYVNGGSCTTPFTISYKQVNLPILENKFSTFTPAIDGLHNIVFEIIPYVVFIGIGMLLSSIGFYAIRRLVNWLSGKINSSFKSKR